MSALDTQVAGSHYKTLKIQPVEYIHANGIGYMAGNVIKYLTRYKDKGGIADLEKAKHYIELLIELESGGKAPKESPVAEAPKDPIGDSRHRNAYLLVDMAHAWIDDKRPMIDGMPYISRSALLNLMVEKGQHTENNARKKIHRHITCDLEKFGILKQAEHGWVVCSPEDAEGMIEYADDYEDDSDA